MKQLKKFFALVLSCVFLLSFSGCIRSQERELEKIPTKGDYIMRSGLFMNQGNTIVDIKEEIRKKIMKEKFVLADDVDYCYTNYAEKDGIIYFAMCYKSKNSEYNNEILKSESDNYYAFGYTPVFDVDVKIVDYFMLRANVFSRYQIGLFGDYFVSQFGERDEPQFIVYNIETLERVDFDSQGYTYQTSSNDVFLLTKKDGTVRHYRVYDENLSVYEYSRQRDKFTEVLYGEYLLFYDNNAPEETAQAVRYKTNETLSNEDAYAVYLEMKNSKGEDYAFKYNGKKYALSSEEVEELLPTGKFDENGKEIFASKSYTNLVFTDIDTKEEFATTNLRIMQRAPKMKDIQEIYDVVEFNQFEIYEQDGELYFLFCNLSTFFGMMSLSDNTPQMVFKYKPETQELEYIGFAYRGVTRIYEGIL